MKKFLFCLCCLMGSAEGQALEAYEFASAAINALSIVKGATSTPMYPKDPARIEATVIASVKFHAPLAKAIPSAIAKLNAFADSKDPEIRQSAANLVENLTRLQATNERVAAMTEKLLANPQEALGADGTGIRDFVALQRQIEADWGNYALSAGLSIMLALVDSKKPSNGGRRYLKIPQAHVELLKLQIRKDFGRFRPEDGHLDNRNRSGIPADVLFDFLDDPNLAY